jgi:3-oxoacyl-[acyl-carrier-protein] synthase-3
MNLVLSPCLGIEIAGTGVGFPADLPREPRTDLTNRQWCRLFFGPGAAEQLASRGLDWDFPETRAGVKYRQWLRRKGHHAAHLGAVAASAALQSAGISPSEIDLLVTATSTPPRITSSLSGLIVAAVGMPCASFDVRAGGVAGLCAWITAVGYLRAGARRVLVVAAETPSVYASKDDPIAASLLGDGAGALVLCTTDREPAPGFLGGSMQTTAPRGTTWTVPGPLPPTAHAIWQGEYRFRPSDAEYNQQLRDLRIANVKSLTKALPALVSQCTYLLSSAPTQRQALAEQAALGNARAELATTLEAHGYLGCAGALVAVHELRAGGQLRNQDLLLLTAVAGGVHQGWMFWQV